MWWLSSTAGYEPGNEAREQVPGRLCTRQAVPFPRASLVFIRATRKNFRSCQQAFRLRSEASEHWMFRRSVLSFRKRHRFRITSSYRSKARERFDYVGILHPIFSKSSRKYFRFFGSDQCQIVEKFSRCLWKKMWKSPIAEQNKRLALSSESMLQKTSCGKPGFQAKKNIFEVMIF